jgi:hypothetical protein
MIVEQSVDRSKRQKDLSPRLGVAHGRLQGCLPHVVCACRPARCSGPGQLPARSDVGVVIRAGVSAKVQSLGSVNIVRGTLDDIGRIGLRLIRPIRGTAGDKRSDGEGKPDQANATSKRSSSGHRRGFLDRIGPVSRNIICIGRTMLLDRGLPSLLG